MPPKRKSKASGLAEVSTPKAASTPARDDDTMDVDTPQAADTPRAADTPTASKPNLPPASEILNNLWSDDQESSLFKAVIRWKPSGTGIASLQGVSHPQVMVLIPNILIASRNT